MKAKTPRHIIWDWNGTLLDDAWLCVEVMNGMLGRRGLPGLTAARYQDIFDFPVEEYYRRLGFDFSREPFSEVGTEFIEGYEKRRHECRLQANAQEALQTFQEAGLRQVILSAQKQTTLNEAVNQFGIAHFFPCLRGIDDHYAAGKKEQGLGLIRELAVDPGLVLLIGDTTHDGDVARAMGAGCCLVASGHHAFDKLTTCGVPVYNSLDALMRDVCAEW